MTTIIKPGIFAHPGETQAEFGANQPAHVRRTVALPPIGAMHTAMLLPLLGQVVEWLPSRGPNHSGNPICRLFDKVRQMSLQEMYALLSSTYQVGTLLSAAAKREHRVRFYLYDCRFPSNRTKGNPMMDEVVHTAGVLFHSSGAPFTLVAYPVAMCDFAGNVVAYDDHPTGTRLTIPEEQSNDH